jgi:HSP20 family protein
MPKHSRRRRNSRQKHAEQPQHLPAAKNDEAPQASSSAFEPMERFMQAAFMPLAWFRPWVAIPPAPKLDVIDRDNTVLVRAEVPGVRKNSLEVEASDLYVRIKGTVEHEEAREDEHYRIAETRRGAFERTVSLPSEVDSAKAKATFKDGVIEVTLPKLDRSRPHALKL